ncbi:MAG TPA: YqiJ family protein [Anaeromyxobacter sp.]|nr:YqiJ family protein [Anaeromyxobacter sp.]
MLSHLFEAGNLPFLVALLVMVGLGLVEGVTTLLGAGLSSALENLAPDVDLDVSIDGPSLETPGVVTRFLGWLRVGSVPLLVLLVLFLLWFGLGGIALQGLVAELTGRMLPAWIAAAVVAMGVLPMVRASAGALARILPKDETEAVSRASFVGRLATVTLGTAAANRPAQAKLRDPHGLAHYVLVEPDLPEEEFPAGTVVLLVSQRGAVFRAIRNPKPELLG